LRTVATGAEHWAVVKATLVEGIPGRRGRLVVNVFNDITERRRAEHLQRFLAEASELLSASLDYAATLETLARLAVPTLADICIVDVLHDDAPPERVTVSFADPFAQRAEGFRRRTLQRVPHSPLHDAVIAGRSVLSVNVTDEQLQSAAGSPEHLAM